MNVAEVILELERAIRSEPDKLTTQEVDIMAQCKGVAIRDFAVGACIGAGLTWFGTRRLGNFLGMNLAGGTRTTSNFFHIYFAGGAAAITGLLGISWSLESSFERILSMEGSRMQNELAKIMLRQYRDDPLTVKLIPRYFYCEKVFEDTSPNMTSRWRHRNFSGDDFARSGGRQDSQSYTDKTGSKESDLEPKQVFMNDVYEIANPFDCVFGGPSTVMEIRGPDPPSALPKRHHRSHKRYRRRHRMRHEHEEEW